MDRYQIQFDAIMEAQKHVSEDPSYSYEVRQYAKSVFMTMQAQQALIQYQELEEVNEMFPARP